MFPVKDLLKLADVPLVGSRRFMQLVDCFGSPDNVFAASFGELIKVDGIDEKIAKNIVNYKENKKLNKSVNYIERSGVSLISLWDETYPENLKHIYDPPPFLYVKGTLSENDNHAISIVGTRNASEYGLNIAEKLASDLVLQGITIISGLASGIDSMAHWGAVKADGRTIAIMGCGIDRIYPSENVSLYKKVIQQGAVISEFPIGTKPEPGNFPRRNRVISGLSLGVVIIEARKKSGAKITADFALEQNREVFAVPGNINSPASGGTNELIKQGAKLVQTADDILEELQHCLKRTLKKKESPPKKPDISLNPKELLIFNHITSEPIHIDKLAKTAEVTTAEALSILLTLELKGIIKQLPGKLFIKE